MGEVDGKSILQGIADANKSLLKKSPLSEGSSDDPRVFMFFSVDLVNGTKFKSERQKKWTSALMRFYEIIKEQVLLEYKNIIKAKVWKHSGDEVLFYLEVEKIRDILEAPKKLHKAMMLAQREFQTALEKEDVGKTGYFKGALWIASAHEGHNPDDQNTASKDAEGKKFKQCNIYVKKSIAIDVKRMIDAAHERFLKNIDKSIEESSPVSFDTLVSWISDAIELDFLGPEIDEGFRIAERSIREKIAIDPKIAYLINGDTDTDNIEIREAAQKRMQLIDCVKLKGVWNERPYPIIWYDENADRKTFSHDDRYTHSLVRVYFSTDDEERSIENISKIIDELNNTLDTSKSITPLASIEDIKYILKNREQSNFA
ncbi:MAG: hypothetical protein FWC70_10870 [Defluviitaleaceae bacterium]|nr:hypothetical protein [Defluviitaleaceae bacterium]